MSVQLPVRKIKETHPWTFRPTSQPGPPPPRAPSKPRRARTPAHPRPPAPTPRSAFATNAPASRRARARGRARAPSRRGDAAGRLNPRATVWFPSASPPCYCAGAPAPVAPARRREPRPTASPAARGPRADLAPRRPRRRRRVEWHPRDGRTSRTIATGTGPLSTTPRRSQPPTGRACTQNTNTRAVSHVAILRI